MAFLTMEDSTCGYTVWEQRLFTRFPCNLAGFSALCTLPLKHPELPWKSLNLSPKPIPKGDSAEDAGDSRRERVRRCPRTFTIP